jgi:hypothetical protein
VSKYLLGMLLVVMVGVMTVVFGAGKGWLGRHEGPGEVTPLPRPPAVVAQRLADLSAAASDIGVAKPRQILFGDLHVHTTISFDAFIANLPMMQGEGSHPQADACDFARYCSALDFWSINDHAEGLTPRGWRETIESIRQCNQVAGDSASPDTVAFLGWEWTQVGTEPDNHYGHKNVVLAHTDDERIPSRTIAARSTVRRLQRGVPTAGLGLVALMSGDRRYHDLAAFLGARLSVGECEVGVGVRDLPVDCVETAETPGELFGKLDEWGHDAIVIPHGTTWGMYTPPGSTWDKQLTDAEDDPDRQTLFEIYSGHGNSDEYRDWRAVVFDDEGVARCPEPSARYLPSCWRAGEIIRERCLAQGLDPDECDERAETARTNAAEAMVAGHLTVPGATAEQWLDAGQCRDCDQPAFNYRPGGSAQYVLAIRDFDQSGEPRRARFGFMSSSDNHFARPGTGYKEVYRRGMTESNRILDPESPLTSMFRAPEEEPVAESRPFDPETTSLSGFQLFEMERQASFFMTGGLIAAHSEGRGREAVWAAMKRREVYGTSGPRILLWFDLLNPPGSLGARLPMGSEVRMSTNPIFQVRAVGSLVQKPGCPDYAASALSPERLQHVCKGECYNPGDRRRLITRIEVVRVRPQNHRDEPVAELIESPWRSFSCEPDPAGCSITFEDPDYAVGQRDTLYYVRVIEEPAPGVNVANLRCDYDEDGQCLRVDLCGGLDVPDDDCLAEHEPRAWSSPIFVDFDVQHSRGMARVAGR